MSWNVRVKGPYAAEALAAFNVTTEEELRTLLKRELDAGGITAADLKGPVPVRIVDDKARKPRLADG